MAYQDDKYENFLADLPVGREARAKFADFSVEAVAAPGVDPMISGHGAGLALARDAYRKEIVERYGAGGVSQAGTVTEAAAFAKFKKFIQDLDVDMLQSYFRRNPDEEARLYPTNLAGLTQAIKKNRLTVLTNFTDALQATPALPKLPIPAGAPAGTQPQTPGEAADDLLTAYRAAATTRTKGRTSLADAIKDLTPAEIALGEALWDIHTAALYVHRREPQQARKYFDYAHLPHRVTKGSAGGKKKAA